MSDQLAFLWEQLPNLLIGLPQRRPGGLLLTILLSIGALSVGVVLATGLALAKHSPLRIVGFLAGRIVWAVRGIPLIVLLVLLFQMLGTGVFWGLELSSFCSAAVTLSLYSSVYLADVIGAGIAAVPQQLRDDARVLGSSRFTTLRTVTLPYAFRVMRPALATQAITIFKDTSVVAVLGVADLTTTARIVLGGDVTNAPYWVATYLTVGFLYWCVAFGLSRATVATGHSARVLKVSSNA